MNTPAYRLGYRGDIEGLRAIAILLVVAAHAKVKWMAGGFVGVDVFFVLSGYLITGVLLREIKQSGHLRFANFYARRFRRLLPALLVMIAVTSFAAAVMLAPGEQGGQAVAAATAAMWLSNIHFAFANLDYFSPGAASNLFLHTWSLGVEEQFYLVWPVLLLGVLGLWRGTGEHAKRLKFAMLSIFAASLLACVIVTHTAPQMAFYMMPLRAWQFAAGALVWLYFGSSSACQSSHAAFRYPLANRWLGWLGLSLIVVAGVWFDANDAYPSWRALLPTAGAVAIILAGSHSVTAGASRLLCWRPLQSIGHVSYSWYLWHWPVLLLGAALVPTDNATYRVALVAFSLLLAAMSYRWVEAPIRHQARWTARPGITVLSALALMLTANVMCIKWFNSAANWMHSPNQQRYAKARGDAPAIYRMRCDDWYHSDKVHPCWFGPRDAKHTVVLLGDSIGAQWFPAVARVFDRPDWRVLVLTKSSCPMVDEPMFYPRIGRDYSECTTWRNHALEQVASLHPDIVILGSVQTPDFTQAQWVDGTARVLQTISPNSGHIYLLRGTPHLPFDGPSCLSAHSWMSWLHARHNTCHAPAYDKHANGVYQWLEQASGRFANVTALDMNDAVCPDGECAAERDGVVVFRDAQHMTATFAESLSSELSHRVGREPAAQATRMQ